MKAQLEPIRSYILQNTIPESMQKIANLPYHWTHCTKTIDDEVEKCFFKTNQSLFWTQLSIHQNQAKIDIYEEKSHTGIKLNLIKNENGRWIIKKFITPYSNKNSGICAILPNSSSKGKK